MEPIGRRSDDKQPTVGAVGLLLIGCELEIVCPEVLFTGRFERRKHLVKGGLYNMKSVRGAGMAWTK